MTQKTINLGSDELAGDGESIRAAFNKVNLNFDELYHLAQDFDAITKSIIPDTDLAYDLGSVTNRFRDLYLSGNTIDLGGTALSVSDGVLQIDGIDINDVVTTKGIDYNLLQNLPNLNQYLKITDIQDSTITIDVNNTGNLQGSVFGDDSTKLVDGINNALYSSSISITPNQSSNFAVGDFGYNVVTDGVYSSAIGGNFGVTVGGNVSFNSDGHISLLGNEIVFNAIEEDITLVSKTGTQIVTLDNDFGQQSYDFGADGVLTLPGTIQAGNILLESTTSPGSITLRHTGIGGIELDGATTVTKTLTASGGITGDLNGSLFADNSTMLVDGINGKVIAPIDTATITNSNGNLSVTASNYVIIDSNNNGQIEIGRASGLGNVIIGNNDNGTEINLQGDTTVPILDVTDEIRTNTIKIYPGASVGTEVMYIGINASEVRFEQDIVTNASSVIRAIDTDDTDAAGNLTIRGGANPGTAPGGNVTINGGTGSTDGNVNIGSTGTGAVSIGNTSGGSIDIYGGVEFNNGTTAFQNGQTLSVNTNNFYAREIHGPVDGTLYLGGRTSSAKVNNIAMDSTRTLLQQDVRLSNDSTLSFASGTTVNFANANLQNLVPAIQYTKFYLQTSGENIPLLSPVANSSYLGENWGVWYTVASANAANLPTGMAPSNATYDPTLTGITYNTDRFQGFVQGGVYEFMIEIETQDSIGRTAEIETYGFETSTGDFANFTRYYPGNNLYQTLQFSAVFHFESASATSNWVRILLHNDMQATYYVPQAIFTIKRIA